MSYKTDGYHKKYNISYADTGKEVTDRTFTLIPDRDPHALKALLAYADSVKDENPQLANDIYNQFTPEIA